MIMRFILGGTVMLGGSVWGFTQAGGKIDALLHLAEVAIVLSFIFGNLMVAYEREQITSFVRDLFATNNVPKERLKSHARLCGSAAVSAFTAGIIATLLTSLAPLGNWTADSSIEPKALAAPLTGILLGLIISSMIFRPLRDCFMNKLETSA